MVSGVPEAASVPIRVAVVQDDAGHVRRSQVVSGKVADPLLTWEAPADGARVRGEVELRAVAAPDDPSYTAVFERQVGDKPFQDVGMDESSPVYTAFDDTSDLENGTVVHYRVRLFGANGRVLADAGVNVTDLQTRLARELYVMIIDAAVPPGLALEELDRRLRAVAAEQGVTISVRPADADVL